MSPVRCKDGEVGILIQGGHCTTVDMVPNIGHGHHAGGDIRQCPDFGLGAAGNGADLNF